jgi:SAM-dependent methyltransferase
MNLTTHQPSYDLQGLLVCPICKGGLTFSPENILCTLCQTNFPQMPPGLLDLIPAYLFPRVDSEWQERQLEMWGWYESLLASPSEAISTFNQDYAPYAPMLTELSGSILDIGGGNGIVRHFLLEATTYVAIDPSVKWLRAEWQLITNSFPHPQERLNFVRGVGEFLPFPAHSFDHVLSFWSLNHTVRPEMVFQEVFSVLRSGGRFLIVLEDMEPRWGDMNCLLSTIHEGNRKRAYVISKVKSTIRLAPWPLQKDHIRIREADIVAWSAGRFAITMRQWIGECLTYELCRL